MAPFTRSMSLRSKQSHVDDTSTSTAGHSSDASTAGHSSDASTSSLSTPATAGHSLDASTAGHSSDASTSTPATAGIHPIPSTSSLSTAATAGIHPIPSTSAQSHMRGNKTSSKKRHRKYTNRKGKKRSLRSVFIIKYRLHFLFSKKKHILHKKNPRCDSPVSDKSSSLLNDVDDDLSDADTIIFPHSNESGESGYFSDVTDM